MLGVRAYTSSRRMYGDYLGKPISAALKTLELMSRSVFNDFGKDFACVDSTGEQPQTGMIVHVEEVSLVSWVCPEE